MIGRARFVAALTVLLLTAVLSASSVALSDANSRDGCMDQWLFNGIWRVQVTKVDPLMDNGQQVGWQVTEVWRNGSTQNIAPADSVLKDEVLELGNGSIAASDTTTGTLSLQPVQYHSFAPAAEFHYTQIFRASNFDPSNKPKALDIAFDGAKLATIQRPQFTSKHYNYHFKLDCVATGAAAQAEGGSVQIAAVGGCRNQWLSNGIWKMRATEVAPFSIDPGSPQAGWLISEEWVNQSGRELSPADTFFVDQDLITASAQDIAATQATTGNLNQQQMVFRNFAAGSSFDYQQRFLWSPFDASDKPSKLLVKFDATKQNARTNAPHFKLPANFRIDLSCSK